MDAQCNILVTAGNVKCFIQVEVWICVFGLTVCLIALFSRCYIYAGNTVSDKIM